MRYCLYSLFVAFIFPFTITAQTKKIRIEKTPGWVTEKTIDYNNTSLDKNAEDGYMDIEYERQVNIQTQCVYHKSVTRIISESGIENVSQVSVNYDPSYQEITFHSLFIIREGKKINKLDASKFKVVQEESELDERIYNGKLSALMILEDVRKGDAIEYSYSKKGFNPVFNGKYSDDFYTAFRYPICNLYYKVITRKGRNINFKNFVTDIKPLISKTGTGNIYEWSAANIDAVHEEDNTPGWYESDPEIMLSEYSTWKEVNDWAMPLFSGNVVIAPSLQKKIDEISAAYNTN